MHCELLVPGLLGAAVDVRLPALELLIARGRRSLRDTQALEEWLAGQFEVEPQGLAAGALSVLAEGDDPGGATWARADPIHLRLLRDRVVVVPGAAFRVAQDEADALCATLNRHFEGRLALRAQSPGRWVARLSGPLELPLTCALAAAGRELIPGAAGDALLNEVQMALHEHPVNEAREARGEPAINSLWLWGAGSTPTGARARWQSVTADDLVVRGLACVAKATARPAAASVGHWLERAPEDGRHLVVLDALRAPLALADPAGTKAVLQELERDWFAPLLDALRAARIGMVTLHVPDAGLEVETIRGDLRRLWKRPRPLAAWIR
jgi:hypothetical protein